MQHKNDLWYLVLPIAIFTIAITGYRFAESDQAAYIPLIRRIVDPSLYPGDYFVQYLPSDKRTILLPIVAYLSKLFPLEWVFFVGYLAAMFGLFWAVYRLAFALFGNREIAWISVLLLCIARRQDYAITTQETFFTFQPVAMPFCIIALCFFVEGRYIRAAVFNAIAFLLHPIAALPVFLVLSLYVIFNIHHLGWQMVLKTLGAFLLTASPLLIIAAPSMGDSLSGTGLFQIASNEWMDIQHRRNEYTFPVLWDRASWRHLLGIVALLVASMFLKIRYAGIDRKDQRSLWIVAISLMTLGLAPLFGSVIPLGQLLGIDALLVALMFLKIRYAGIDRKDQRSLWIVGISLMTLGLAHLFGSVIPLGLIFQLHLYRGLYMLMYIAFIYGAFVIWNEYQQYRSTLNRAVIIMSAGAIATGDDILTLLAILACVLLWLRTNTSSRVLHEILGVVGLLVTGYIIFRSSGDLMFLAMIGTPILLFLILEILRKEEAMEWGALHQFGFLCLLLIVVVAAKIHQNGVGIKFPFSTPNDSWSQVQYWAAENTPKGAVFIVPPDTRGFRIFSKRSIVGDIKDGGANSYSESFAKEWSRRMKQLQSYQNFTDAEFMELAKEYKASFIVTRCGQTLSFPKAYQNSDFCVYEKPR